MLRDKGDSFPSGGVLFMVIRRELDALLTGFPADVIDSFQIDFEKTIECNDGQSIFWDFDNEIIMTTNSC